METQERKLINRVTKKGPYLAFCCILLGLLLHVVGVSTNHWLEGSRLDGPENTKDVVRVNVGLFSQRLEYRNWTVAETDSMRSFTRTVSVLLQSARMYRIHAVYSALTIQTPQTVILIIACTSAVLCSITIVKSIHVVVGTSGFIAMPLLVVSLVLLRGDMEIARIKVQAGGISWPPVSVSWSFHLVFSGLLINTVSTALFLTLQLMKSNLEAEAKRPKPDYDIHKVRLSTTGF